MITDLTSPYLEKLREHKAGAGTIVISDTERLVPVRGGYLRLILPPKEVRDKQLIPIIHKRQK